MATASLSSSAALTPTTAPWTARREPEFAKSKAWDVYLVIAALLVPTLQPTVPIEQVVIVDVVNAIAIAFFACIAFARKPRLDLPLIVPAGIILVGSMIAITNCESPGKAALTLIQDFYLYAWFIALVAILKVRGDQRGLRIAWMWAANIAAGIGLYMLLTNGTTTFFKIFGAKGFRAVGLFNGPNELADYLMMSLFVVISLAGQSNSFVVWGSFLFQLLVLVATKSNGAMSGWFLGMALWAFIRLYAKSRSLLVTLATAGLLGAAVLSAWLMVAEYGLGNSFENLKKQSFMGRLDKSAEGREVIWHRLFQRYAESPLGIGPGNSSEQRLTMGHSERRKSNRSKEAHNDYLGYLVERGPLGLLGFAMVVVLPFAAVARGFRKVADPAWRSGTGGAIAAALAGGLVATTFHSLTMEKLHFRHYWLFLAITFAFAATPAPRLALAGAARSAHRAVRKSRSRHSSGAPPVAHAAGRHEEER